MGLSYLHILSLVLLSPLLALAYECDTGELRRVEPKAMTQISLKKYKSEATQWDPNRPDGFNQLQSLKGKYKLNAAAEYIFNEPAANTFPENFTTLFEQGTKIFYLNQGRLIAVLDQLNTSEFLLTRLNVKCQPFEMVSFKSLQKKTDLPIRYKITPQFCRQAYNPKTKSVQNKNEETLSYIADHRDPITRRGLQRDCQFLKQSPAALMRKKNLTLAERDSVSHLRR